MNVDLRGMERMFGFIFAIAQVAQYKLHVMVMQLRFFWLKCNCSVRLCPKYKMTLQKLKFQNLKFSPMASLAPSRGVSSFVMYL